jgi:hypothetical protein
MRSFRLLILILPALTACEGPAADQQIKTYFDTKTFVDQQVVLLTKQKPTVQKTVRLDQANQVQQTDSIDWNRELELFRQLDLNKPAFRSSYTTARPDSLTVQYRLKPGEKQMTVQLLTVRLDAATRQPAQISATLHAQNPLYQSERRILLDCGPTKTRQWRVAHYRVEGFRQLTFFSRNEFSIDGRITN